MAIRTSARPRSVGVVLAVVCALLVAGCGDSGEGTATPSTSAGSSTVTPSVSETPTATVTETSALPPLPEAATQNTPEGAEAFVRYYLDVANLAHTGPQSGLVTQLASRDCLSCQEMEEQVVTLETADQRLQRPPYAVLSMERIGGGPPGVQQFNMSVDVVANVYLDVEGDEVSAYDNVSLTGVGAAVWEGDRWLIYDLGLQSS